MIFNNLPILSVMSKKLSWLAQRTEVLAQNVANADTPGFKARDLKEVTFSQLVAQERGLKTATRTPRVTNPAHLQGTVPVREYKEEKAPDRDSASFDGNTVSAEQQLLKLGSTQAEHQMTLNLYRKHLSMMRVAIGRNGG